MTLQHISSTLLPPHRVRALIKQYLIPVPTPPRRKRSGGRHARSPEELRHARELFATGATFRNVRAATGMSMALLKKVKEGKV